MSIKLDILNRVFENRLSVFAQINPRLPDRRAIYLSPQIAQDIREMKPQFGRARALLETFIKGDQIVARWPPDTDVTPMIALLDPQDQNVWEIRIRVPKPGLRIFGMFAEKDVFIGIHCYERDALPADNNWSHEISLCRHAWGNLFPTYPPLSGSNIHDYISNARLPP
jgi:hypothetical protein